VCDCVLKLFSTFDNCY